MSADVAAPNTAIHTELACAQNVDPSRRYVGEWRRLNSIHGHIETAVTNALSDVGLSLVEFTVLDILQEQMNGHMRMQDVALVAGLTTGATTRLVNRLEQRELLRRVLCAHDRRGIYTELAPDGEELLTRARARHDGAVGLILSSEQMIQAMTEVTTSLRSL
ncbi:MarR family transcriptional regulator [Xanthomonas perforans]